MPEQIFIQSDKRWLNNDAAIWRYVPLRTLFLYLNGLVFIPSIAKLREEDPFEGEFYENIAWFNDAFHKHYGDRAKDLEQWIFKTLCSDSDRHFIEINKNYLNAAAEVFRRHYFEFVRRTRFASCWFHSYRESAAMWSGYGNQGVAIQTSVQKLVTALETTDRSFVFGRMTYGITGLG